MKVAQVKKKQLSDPHIRAARNILRAKAMARNAWTQFRRSLIFTPRRAAAGHAHGTARKRPSESTALIERRTHRPGAVHLQGYTPHCCIGRELDLPPPPPPPPSPPSRRSVTLCSHPVLFALGLIEISTVDRGVISLFGVRSEMFVAMNSRGRLYGTVCWCATPGPGARAHARANPVQCKMSSWSCCIHGFMSAVVLLICADDGGGGGVGLFTPKSHWRNPLCVTVCPKPSETTP